MARAANRSTIVAIILLAYAANPLARGAEPAKPPANEPTSTAKVVLPVAGASNQTQVSSRALASSRGVKSSLISPAQLHGSPSGVVFIENRGQFDPKVRFQVKIGAQTAWLTADGVAFDATRPAAEQKEDATPDGDGGVVNPVGLPGPLAGRRTVGPQKFDRLAFAENFLKASCCSNIEAKSPQPGSYNYFLGRDPSTWYTHVRGYSEVVYYDVWPGIDLRLYGNGSNLEQEFVVRPGGDLARVQINYRGIDKIVVAPDGALEVNTAFGKLRETKPAIYQQIGGRQVAVDGRFKLTSETSYAFEVGVHQSEYALVIDPTLLYSTFLGGSAGLASGNVYEEANSIAVDSSGNAYVAGYTSSTDFPTTPGAFLTVSSGSSSFITKMNATGSALVYSTYLNAGVSALAIDTSGHAFVTGRYAPIGFPTTSNAYYPTNSSQHCTSGDFFVTELNATGDGLIYSTCLGIDGNASYGAVYGYFPFAIAVDSQGHAYIAGGARGVVPTTASAYQPSFPGAASAYLAVFDTTTSGMASLTYATYLGSATPIAVAYGLAMDAFGKAYITGAASPGFPVTPGAFQTTHSSANVDAFVAKLDPSASGTQSLIYSTYLGGAPACGSCGGANGLAIAVNGAGEAYVAGSPSGGSFPTTPGALSTAGGGGFVAKLGAGGSTLLYSTYLGSAGSANINQMTLDALGDAYVVGFSGNNLPVTADAFQGRFCNGNTGVGSCSTNAFLTELNPSGSGLIYSTYLSGSHFDTAATAVAVDQAGDVYVAGYTESFDFPVTPSAFQPALNPNPISCGNGGGCRGLDVFITKFPLGSGQALSLSSLTPTSGGNAGTVSPQIFGTGLHAGATAQLVCGVQPIVGSNPIVGPGGRYLNASFNLTGTSPGKCDVTVTNPDGTSASLSQALTVQQGGTPNIRIYLTGLERRKVPPEIVLGPADALIAVTISNIGSVDSSGVLVSLPVDPPFTPTSATPTSLDDTSALPTTSVVQWLLPVPAGTSQVVMATTSSPSQSTSPMSAQTTADQNTQFYAGCVGDKAATFFGTSCSTNPNATKFQLICEQAFEACIEGNKLSDCNNALSACYRVLNMCKPPGADIVKKQCDCTQNGSQSAQLSSQAQSSSGTGCGSTTTTLPIVVPTDPNDLVGPPGVGGQRWIAGAQGQTYAISFSNIPTAPVPAQEVIVTMPLESNVNLSSLSLLGITVPNGTNNAQASVPAGAFNPSAGVNEFITNIDLRPTQNLLVNVDALLNPSTQTLTWTLTSIDPSTGQPPVNPLVGFLPAGAEGSVSFGVTSKPGLATGTQIAEQASIVFVGNSPMSTAAWTNTIDNSSPVSQVTALSAAQSCPNFRVNWSGSDLGSGLQGFTIYVSDTGAPFTPWLTNTTSAGATYAGAAGHSYGFYSIATDLVGNVELAKTLAEATTTVSTTPSCGPPSIGGKILSSTRSGTTETVNLQLTNTGSSDAQTVNIKTIALRTLSGSGTVTLTSPTLPVAEGPLALGASVSVPLTFNVPSTVTRFSVTESGSLAYGAGSSTNFSIAQTVIP